MKGLLFNPGYSLFALIIAGILSLLDGKKRRRRKSAWSPTSSPGPTQEEINISKMQQITRLHSDCTAEVLNFNVFGKRKVSTIRLIDPGDKIEVRCYKDEYKVFLYGEFMADLYPPKDSLIPRLFAEGVKFESYLGGRDMAMLYTDDIDFCSAIIFYKIPGIGPTKVNLR